MNTVSISGRLVYEPEIRVLSNGKKKLPIRLAVSRNDKNKTTDFFSLQAWDNTAEFIAKYFHKGDPIEVMGRLRTDSFEKQDGTKVTETYVQIQEVNFVLSKRTDAERAPTAPPSGGLPFEI